MICAPSSRATLRTNAGGRRAVAREAVPVFEMVIPTATETVFGAFPRRFSYRAARHRGSSTTLQWTVPENGYRRRSWLVMIVSVGVVSGVVVDFWAL